ncbi:50S ribosomal protein L18Ae [Candidatus Nanohalobium constans]|uniref:Large ribosomal subunit protein eL20 n=1 Tax=Candidatus Nanohalobium constans TaxID=2565781 RepID=A0A5Q0UGQ0_9ARCH|nr:50S ribosomal protein L18Ae [Candidatus Nanohalobium constans]QGA80551.1 50S ribosomal protein L18a [Candidatus Nanohalobium constans]
MTTFEFSGEIQLGNHAQPFDREIEAESEKHAKDKLYSELGSEHSKPRSSITIEESQEA